MTVSYTIKHFLDLDQIDGITLRNILEKSKAYKESLQGSRVVLADGSCSQPLLDRQILAMLFERPSTRTRVSFEVAIHRLGGDAIVLHTDEMQLHRGETMADTSRVLSRYVNAIMIRCCNEASLITLAAHSSVPVINGLTNRSHPCQVMADIMTFEEHRGPIAGAVVTWIGDGNNVCRSWIHAAARFGFTMRIATPESLAPDAKAIAWARKEGANIELGNDPVAAIEETDLVVTDTWVSMGSEDQNRRVILTPFCINESMMAKASPHALFMHCLPAHRGEEVTDAVMDGPQSVVFDEAENRVYAQMGILAWCMS